MPPNEPILRPEDHRVFNQLRATARAYAATARHRAKVDESRRAIQSMREKAPDAEVAWSAGKDSTALAHICATEGVTRAMSVKDDLDYPGEDTYLEARAAEWGITLTILRPPFSLQDWLRDCGAAAGDDLHGRATEFSERGFYSLLNERKRTLGYPGIYLGLRAEESRGRRLNHATRGMIYAADRDGTPELTCQPLAKWTGLDVWAYIFSHDIEPLPVYRCVALHHAADPSRLRKSWWVAGSASQDGHVLWLRYYYPSLYARLVELMPDAKGYA